MIENCISFNIFAIHEILTVQLGRNSQHHPNSVWRIKISVTPYVPWETVLSSYIVLVLLPLHSRRLKEKVKQ
jgi:hypothetical protein